MGRAIGRSLASMVGIERRREDEVGDLYLVTGGAGFIGSHVVAELLSRGHAVRVLDNFSTGRRGNLTAVGGDVEIFEGDMRSYERAHNAVKGADLVIHLAALPSVPRSVQDPLTTNEANITGTLNVLLAARDNGVRRVVLASSSSIYGANLTMPKREDMVPEPISPYAVSKLAAEQYARAFATVYGLETVSLRYFNVFGPRQDPTSQYSGVVPRFMRLALEGNRPVVYGDGEQSRDFTYVANVVDATLSAATAPDAAGNICNVGCGDPKTVLDLIAAVGRAVGRSLEPEFVPPMAGDVKHSFADITLARRLLGYEPRVGFDEGIERTFAWLVEDMSSVLS
jgi:nucleoside-diphosphate-sugar epimerase